MKSKDVFLIFLIFLFLNDIYADEQISIGLDKENRDCENITRDTLIERIFSSDFVGTFNGKRVEYTASLKEKIIYEKDNPDLPMASFFYTEYIAKNNNQRPVIFSFNGGPGSA